MDFRLIYEGPLGANKGPREKHAIRRAIHPQLVELTRHAPFHHGHRPLSEDKLTACAGFKFYALIGDTSGVKLTITFLRPEVPGHLVLKGGDIDNRIKTLLDALCIPSENQVPQDIEPSPDENPFYCLLSDDRFVLGLDIDTDRLLKPSAGRDPTQVFLLIKVTTRALPNARFPSLLHLP